MVGVIRNDPGPCRFHLGPEDREFVPFVKARQGRPVQRVGFPSLWNRSDWPAERSEITKSAVVARWYEFIERVGESRVT